MTAKDVVLSIIARLGTGGGIGSIIEYRGSVIRALSMEGRMTVCNMSIEAGARAGLVAPDDTTFSYLEGRPFAPRGAAWERALDDWRSLRTDDDATFDQELVLDGAQLAPAVSWGTNPAQTVTINDAVPDPDSFSEPGLRDAARLALRYMGLTGGTPIREIPVDTVFIGSCTNARLEDLRAAAGVLAGRHVRPGLRALVVPGSGAGAGRGGGRGAGPGVHRGRVRVARAGLLDVPGHEPRQARHRRAVRVDVEPQLRGPPGQGGPHPPGVPGGRGRDGGGGHLRGAGGPRLMDPVREIVGRAVPLDRSNVDTDQIIPSDWLKRVERTGFGEGLFSEWRESSDFVLNQAHFQGDDVKVLVSGPNFGIGSSREHAVWALQDFGFEAVIAPRFGDIFRTNALKGGLLPVELPEPVVRRILDAVADDPTLELVVDVVDRRVALPALDLDEPFELEDYAHHRLLHGLDDIAVTLALDPEIAGYEAGRAPWLPRVSP